ncbi:hypothetical protein CGH72_08460 [Vibrio parahaemolyticus]|uniref:hypothetical protein n=1 Tax=Vibrio harveyi group TaxID=717610 RepID=UPI001122786C|nr:MULTISPECIES: hypothetical protein [Vibrio harveyi group]MCQ9091082.1 hypothetical protein [Vibrio alginolyticus]TOK04608.1 hypothetical protein CGI25_22300 [Vibrio parahaemolyticus]TOM64749.1 hypothetical protein CGH73_20890 [Vibrio parahaemolyticus]TOM73484.1 hypothetical protein CGH72_08460 [Vibrio parahaemolyticus]TON02627.1 hypothetical protein CGH67_21480 [Vibrio parahaemolyticus]
MMRLKKKMRWSGLGAVMLAGCASAPNDDAVSCVQTLSTLDVFTQPHDYQQAFEHCEEPITQPELVQRYVQALVSTGQFETLLSPSLFHDNVDTELATQWTTWIEANL